MTILFKNNEGLIGDALCTLPFMIETCNINNTRGRIQGDFNPWVWQGLTDEIQYLLSSNDIEHEVCYALSCSTSWQYCFENRSQHHMLQGHFLVNGLASPKLPYKLHFKRDPCDLPSGIIFAPFSRSNFEYNKCWPEDRWIELAQRLSEEYKGLIYLLGDSKNDNFEQFNTGHFIPVMDKPLAFIASLLDKAPLIVTVDTGISHLCHFMSLKQHLLLYPNASPKNFAESPFAVTIYDEPKNITVEQVLLEAKMILSMNVDNIKDNQ